MSHSNYNIITSRALADGRQKNVKIVAPFKSLSNVWRTIETHFINCEISS